MTLYLTGGHLTPALAIIDAIQKKREDVTLIFFGRDFSQQASSQPSRERAEMQERQIPFVALDAPKMHRTNLIQNILELPKVPRTLFTILKQFRASKPDVILSFGGYLALPVCLLGKVFGARVITHEQTVVAGLANQVIAHVADVIALAHEESVAFFPKGKTVLTGNPIRESLFREYKTPPSWFQPTSVDKPIVFITGGSQGSHVINQTVRTLLARLLRTYVIVHQCGPSQGQEVLKELEREREKLPAELQGNYVVREWIEAKEVSFFFRQSHFIICRAGANTVQEISLVGVPAIFIPLAYAYNDEQLKNAQLLVQKDAALLIAQKDLYPETLWEAIQDLERRYESIASQVQQVSKQSIRNGTERLIHLLFS